MKGCRPLTSEEIENVTSTLSGFRDKALFILGVSSGFRISELLSLKVKDVWENGKPANRASVSRCNTKGKIAGRSVAIGQHVQRAIFDLVNSEGLKETDALFTSRKGGSIGRKQAWRILRQAYKVAGLTGKVATHSMRKSVAQKAWLATGKDIRKTQAILGHKNINSTISYIGIDNEEIDNIMVNLNNFKVS